MEKTKAKKAVCRADKVRFRAVRPRVSEGMKREAKAGKTVHPSVLTKTKKTVWVVSQLTYPFDRDKQELFNCVFSSFNKAYDFVKREFENDNVKEFDGKSLLEHLCLANEKCEYLLEECEIV